MLRAGVQIDLGQRADCNFTPFFNLCKKLANFVLKTLFIDLKRVVLTPKNVNFDQNTVSFGRKNAISGRNALGSRSKFF